MAILSFKNIHGEAEYVRSEDIVNVTETTVTLDGEKIKATLVILNELTTNSAQFYTKENAFYVATLWAAGEKVADGQGYIWGIDPENRYRRVTY